MYQTNWQKCLKDQYKRCSHWKHQLYKFVIYTSFALKITQFYYHRCENPMNNNSTFLNISLVCDFTVNDGECSYLFKEVHDSATICQALFAYFITPISVPTNLLLIASVVIYRSIIDDSTIIQYHCIHFSQWEIFFTQLILAWWFGYWGCKVVTFIIICGLFARWFTVAFISFDRFCRIFFALIYPRYSKKFMIVLMVSSWLFSLVTVVIMPQWAESAGGTQ